MSWAVPDVPQWLSALRERMLTSWTTLLWLFWASFWWTNFSWVSMNQSILSCLLGITLCVSTLCWTGGEKAPPPQESTSYKDRGARGQATLSNTLHRCLSSPGLFSELITEGDPYLGSHCGEIVQIVLSSPGLSSLQARVLPHSSAPLQGDKTSLTETSVLPKDHKVIGVQACMHTYTYTHAPPPRTQQ